MFPRIDHNTVRGFGHGITRRSAPWHTLLVACLCALGTLSGTTGAEPFANLRDVTIDEFRVGANGEPIVLPVTIGDKTFRLLLDTGAVTSILDDSLRPLLELATDAKTPDAPEPAPTLYRPPPMRVGRVNFGRPEVAVYPGLRDGFATAGVDMDGFLGMNALRDYILHIDFDSGVLRFLSAVDRGFGTAVPLHAKRGTFHATANIAGEDASFLIDTGALSFDTGSLQKPLFDRLLQAGRIRLFTGRDDRAWRLGGVVAIRVAECDGITLGPFRHDHLIVDDTKTDNKLGIGYLQRFAIVFDFPDSTMYIRPSKAYNRRDAQLLGGFDLIRLDGKTVLVGIEPNGEAAAAGLEEFDQLEFVDGIAAKSKSVYSLIRLFTEPGQKKIVYRRGVTQRQTLLFLRDRKVSRLASDRKACRSGVGSAGDETSNDK